MLVLAALLSAADVALGLLVFTLLARPEALLGALARVTGDGAAWDAGRLDDAGRRRLLHLAERAALPALLLLFGWSFLCGALLLAARL